MSFMNTPHSPVDVERLLQFLREQEGDTPTAAFYGDLCADFARVARHLSSLKYPLTYKWAMPDILDITLKGKFDDVKILGVRIQGRCDDQGALVTVSHNLPRRHQTGHVDYKLPHEQRAAIQDVFSRVVQALKEEDRCVHFDPVVVEEPPTWDEGLIKERALGEVRADNLGKLLGAEIHTKRSYRAERQPMLN